jgi:transcriptional regulator with XRE-family HTH domain
MTFAEKIKKERLSRGMDQPTFAKHIGVSPRTISYYENGRTFPRSRDDYKRIADILEVPVDYLLTENDEFIVDAGAKYGSKGRRDARELMEEVSGLFAGGDLADEDLDEMMRGIQEAYWIAKEKNKKYTPKKFIKEND